MRTGLANRKRFDEHILSEWRRAVRHASTVSIVMIQVDYFEGHLGGQASKVSDRVLNYVSKTIKGVARRPGDMVARYSEAEFALVLSET